MFTPSKLTVPSVFAKLKEIATMSGHAVIVCLILIESGLLMLLYFVQCFFVLCNRLKNCLNFYRQLLHQYNIVSSEMFNISNIRIVIFF